MYGDALAIALSTMFWHLDRHFAIEILGGDGVGFQHIGRCALENNLASLASCLRTDVHYPVGSTHHILVVFHYDDRVAQVS